MPAQSLPPQPIVWVVVTMSPEMVSEPGARRSIRRWPSAPVTITLRTVPSAERTIRLTVPSVVPAEWRTVRPSRSAPRPAGGLVVPFSTLFSFARSSARALAWTGPWLLARACVLVVAPVVGGWSSPPVVVVSVVVVVGFRTLFSLAWATPWALALAGSWLLARACVLVVAPVVGGWSSPPVVVVGVVVVVGFRTLFSLAWATPWALALAGPWLPARAAARLVAP